MLITRLRVGHGLPRPPGVETLRGLARPAMRAVFRGELGVLRAAGMPREVLERRLVLPVPAMRAPGRARADAMPRARPTLAASGVVDVWVDGPGRHVLDDWSRLVREHTKELSEGYVKALVQAVGEGIAKGGEWEDIASAVEAVSERFALRVRALSRDELAALASSVTRELQTQVGITHFRWVNRGDGRVRPTHDAAATRDVGFGPGVFSWAQGAPNVGLYGEHGLPGQIRNCRCKARPVLPSELRRGLGGAARRRDYSLGEAHDDPNVPKQAHENACGAATTVMLAKDRGVELEQGPLAAQIDTDAQAKARGHRLFAGIDGGTISGWLSDALPSTRWAAVVWDGAPRGLLRRPGSWAALLGPPRRGHWVVVDGLTPDGRVSVRDPAGRSEDSSVGARRYVDFDEFIKAWNGWIVIQKG